ACAVERAGIFGITVQQIAIDGPAVLQRVRSERDHFASATRASIEELPEGVAKITAKTIIIATGSHPVLPKAFANLGKAALTSDTIFELEDLPESLAVVGSGAIGLELAQAFAHLGVKVSLFDQAETLAKLQTIDLHLGVKVVPSPCEGGVKLQWSGSSKGEGRFDRVLVAVGREPQLNKLELGKANLKRDDRGALIHDRATMRCGESSIFLAGDVAADLPLLHEASHDGAIAGKNAAAYPAAIKIPRYPAFSITFTEPVLASIGASEAEGAVSGTAVFTEQGRARVEACAKGVATIYAAAPDGRLIGADLMAPAGEHLAHLLTWAIQNDMTASRLLEMPFYHPTVEEGLKSALRTICAATPIDLPDSQDTGAPAGG
ncbi:hypothetical protein LTR94_026368, partial [Friedmanniomyces endolithicus]